GGVGRDERHRFLAEPDAVPLPGDHPAAPAGEVRLVGRVWEEALLERELEEGVVLGRAEEKDGPLDGEPGMARMSLVARRDAAELEADPGGGFLRRDRPRLRGFLDSEGLHADAPRLEDLGDARRRGRVVALAADERHVLMGAEEPVDVLSVVAERHRAGDG